MKRDFLAIFRKEWKEILPGRAAGGARLRPLIMVGLMGILVPLQAKVRQAQQTLMFGIVAAGLALSFGLPTLLKWFARNLAAWSAAEVVVGGSAVFLAVDLVLVLAALNRFQRSKLVLD